jgi:hypothetical protein
MTIANLQLVITHEARPKSIIIKSVQQELCNDHNYNMLHQQKHCIKWLQIFIALTTCVLVFADLYSI